MSYDASEDKPAGRFYPTRRGAGIAGTTAGNDGGDMGEGKRVLILVENAPVPGDRRVVHEALSLIADGYSVSVICPFGPGQKLAHDTFQGIDIWRYMPMQAQGGTLSQLAEYTLALVKTFWLMLKVARRSGFDIIHACNPPDLFFVVAWPFKLFGKRFIFDQHDLAPELYQAITGKGRGLVLWGLRVTERFTYAMSDVVIASNESYKAIAQDRGGVSADRVFVVRNGPRDGWPKPVAPDESLKRGRSNLVVYIGVMGWQDGVDALIAAANVLVHDLAFTDVHVAIVGDGIAGESLRAQARELRIEEWVEFVGWTDDEDLLSRYLTTADACVCPETSSPLNDHSTFIKVMEYMASNTPVVAFDLPETRYSAGDAALYAPSGDIKGFALRIREALTDSAVRERIRSAAVKRMPELRWEAQVPSLLDAYRRARQ